jgi:hypothetical protein
MNFLAGFSVDRNIDVFLTTFKPSPKEITMGQASIQLKRHLRGLKPGTLFTSRDCLPFGSRAAIDQALYRLVKTGYIVRYARGVFARPSVDEPAPTIEEIAIKKANSFGRHLAAHGSTLVQEVGLEKRAKDLFIFSTNSSSSTFKCRDITVHLRKTCFRKMSLQKLPVGKAIGALWHLGKQKCKMEQVAFAVTQFPQRHKTLMREAACWVPAWLSRFFLFFRFDAIHRQPVAVL